MVVLDDWFWEDSPALSALSLSCSHWFMSICALYVPLLTISSYCVCAIMQSISFIMPKASAERSWTYIWVSSLLQSVPAAVTVEGTLNLPILNPATLDPEDEAPTRLILPAPLNDAPDPPLSVVVSVVVVPPPPPPLHPVRAIAAVRTNPMQNDQLLFVPFLSILHLRFRLKKTSPEI